MISAYLICLKTIISGHLEWKQEVSDLQKVNCCPSGSAKERKKHLQECVSSQAGASVCGVSTGLCLTLTTFSIISHGNAGKAMFVGRSGDLFCS